MSNIVILGLQGGIAVGTEGTFDGQKMEAGVHLRWSFSPDLGFPPGGFWLCRRIAKRGEKRIPAPPSVATTPAPVDSRAMVSSLPGDDSWQATLSEPCTSVSLAGCAAPGCSEVVIETFVRNSDGKLEVSERRTVPVEAGAFRVRVSAAKISGLVVSGAESVDQCACEPMPPTDCSGQGGSSGGNPPDGNGPEWGDTGKNGWQCWGAPFTLPLTPLKTHNWPARYFGAPNPATTAPATVINKDIDEAVRRLGNLSLVAGWNLTQERAALLDLRDELERLVQGFPSVLLPNVQLNPSPQALNAPSLNLSLMQQLLLLALDPYFARVLGLYFVDTEAKPGVQYDYCLTGYWGDTPCTPQVVTPGLAPAAMLAAGNAVFRGLTIEGNDTTTLWRWTRDDANGNYCPKTDPGAPSTVSAAAVNAVSGLPAANQPSAMLAGLAQSTSWPFLSSPPVVSISLNSPVARVDVQLAGTGTVTGLSAGESVASSAFSSTGLQTVSVIEADVANPIDTIQISGVSGVFSDGNVVMIGEVVLHLITPDTIGTRYAILHAPGKIAPLSPPSQPLSMFRHRQADVDPTTLQLVPRSLINVEWPTPAITASMTTGDPVSDPIDMPAPTRPIGFVLERKDTGVGSANRIPGWIAASSQPTPASSKIPTERLYRFVDSNLPDPIGKWSHRVAGFNIFGALGKWSKWTTPMGIEKIAGAPNNLRIIKFDNTPAAGGATAPGGASWVGGSLTVAANWSGATFLMYPDIRTARIQTASVDITTGNVTGKLSFVDVKLPVRSAQKLTITAVNVTPMPDGTSCVDIEASPPFTLDSTEPAAMLILTLSGVTIERYVVRPIQPVSPGPVVARLRVGPNTRIVATSGAFIGQPAFYVKGFAIRPPTFQVPLVIPIDQTTARGQVCVKGSTQDPFDDMEMIVDPNGVNPNRPEPDSVVLTFTGPQRLVPPQPAMPQHSVDHLYYCPANFTGQANVTLPFTTAAVAGVSGYILQRAAVRLVALADVKARICAGNAADPEPVIAGRADLAAWIAALNDWIIAYNAMHGTNFTAATVLGNSDAQRAFIDHFYGGLLDDELRALADLPRNARAFTSVRSKAWKIGTAVTDSVDGTGFGRNLYNMAAVNSAGTVGSVTGSIGPYYTRIVTPPRPPVLYKLQPTQASIVVAWALDTNPDVAAYLVYRALTADDLSDLRYFGPHPSTPSDPGDLAQFIYQHTQYPVLSIGSGLLDPRIVGFTPDPRLCARDYEQSNMGEVALPGPVPDAVKGVYRLSEYNSNLSPLAQQAFNYWTPPAVSGIARVQTDNAGNVRLTGLRIGLGRGVPVVVVATCQGQVRVSGQTPIRRAGFIDGATPAGVPFDPNAVIPNRYIPPAANTSTAYTVVAVDIFGNVSSGSAIFVTQMLSPTAV